MSTTLPSGPDLRLIFPLSSRGEDVAEAAGSPSPAAGAWDCLIRQVEQIGALTEDWDGQGAAAPAEPVVDWAGEWVRQMRRSHQALPPSRAVPGVAGEIYLEWQGESYYLVAEIPSPTRVEWTLTLPGQPNRHWSTEGAAYFLTPG